MQNRKIAIIGGGNMGSSLIGGLIAHGFPSDDLMVCDFSADKRVTLNKRYGIHTTTSIHEAIQNKDVILFAIKPQNFAEAARACATSILDSMPLIISIAAGIRIASIEYWLNGTEKKLPIVRAMPNTPALIGLAATGVYANANVTDEHHQLVDMILNALGKVFWVNEENLLDTVTALSGSGPAYFYYMMEAMENAAVKNGLPAPIAKQLILQTAIGAATMAQKSKESLATLRQQVTSPGGTTEQGIAVLQQHQFEQIMLETIEAAKKRSEELSSQFH